MTVTCRFEFCLTAPIHPRPLTGTLKELGSPASAIASSPFAAVIDQQSKIVGVVRHSEHDRLESLVRTLLAKSEPPRPN